MIAFLFTVLVVGVTTLAVYVLLVALLGRDTDLDGPWDPRA